MFLAPVNNSRKVEFQEELIKVSENLPTSLSILSSLLNIKKVSLKISHITNPFLNSTSSFAAHVNTAVNISRERFTHLNRTAPSATVSKAINSPKFSS